MAIAGLGSVIYGYMQNNSVEAQLTSIFSSGRSNPGTVFIIVGVVALIVGIILAVAGGVKKNKG